jgi:hypothetical protein
MGRLAMGDPDAGWRPWKGQAVLVTIDHKGEGDNLDRRRIQRYEFVSVLPMLRFVTFPRFWPILCEDGGEQ